MSVGGPPGLSTGAVRPSQGVSKERARARGRRSALAEYCACDGGVNDVSDAEVPACGMEQSNASRTKANCNLDSQSNICDVIHRAINGTPQADAPAPTHMPGRGVALATPAAAHLRQD
jgi:hypothetical protein